MTDDLLAAVRARFDGRAAEYDRSEMHRALAAAVADFADLDGVRDVLDVATGTGLVLRALHSRDGALRLFGIDLSGGMVEVARAELPGATLVEGDATVLPFDDDAFDLVTCATGIHLFPDATPRSRSGCACSGREAASSPRPSARWTRPSTAAGRRRP